MNDLSWIMLVTMFGVNSDVHFYHPKAEWYSRHECELSAAQVKLTFIPQGYTVYTTCEPK